MITEAGLVVARFAHFAGLSFLFGAACAPIYADLVGLETQLRRRKLSALAVVAVSGVLWFALAVAGMAEELGAALDPGALGAALRDMTFGRVWCARIAGSLLLPVVYFFRTPGRRVVEIAFTGALLASIALTGHAQADEGWRVVAHSAADGIHLLAAGLWLGGLSVLAALLIKARGEPEKEIAQRALVRFSPTGMLAVAALVATGLTNSLFLVGVPSALWTTAYGRMLALKLLLFLSMLGLAARNRHLSRAGRPDMAGMKSRVVLEQSLGLAVLGTVALLGTLPPPTSA